MEHKEEKAYWNSIKLMTISSVANSSYLTMNMMSNSNVNGWINNNPISVSIQVNDPRVNKSEKIRVNMYYSDLKDVMFKLKQQLSAQTINTTGGSVTFNSRLSKNTKSITFRFTPMTNRLSTSIILTDKSSSFGRVEIEIDYKDFRKLYMLLEQICDNYVNLCTSFIQNCTNERMIESINNIGPSINSAIESSFSGVGAKIDELKTCLSSIETTISKLGVNQKPLYNDMLGDSVPSFLAEGSLFDTTSDIVTTDVVIDGTSDMMEEEIGIDYFDASSEEPEFEHVGNNSDKQPNDESESETVSIPVMPRIPELNPEPLNMNNKPVIQPPELEPAKVIDLGPLIKLDDARLPNPPVFEQDFSKQIDISVPFEYDDIDEDKEKERPVVGRNGSDGRFYVEIDSWTPIQWYDITTMVTEGTCDASFEPLAMPLNFLGMSKYIDDFRTDPEYFNQQYSILYDFMKLYATPETHCSNVHKLTMPYEYTFKVDDTHELYNTLITSGIINSAYFILSNTYNSITQYNDTIKHYSMGRQYTHRVFLSLFAAIDFKKVNEDKLKSDITNAFIDLDNRGFFKRMHKDYESVTDGGKLRMTADLVVEHLLLVVTAIEQGKFFTYKDVPNIFKVTNIPYHKLHAPSEVKTKCINDIFIIEKNNKGIDPTLQLYLKCVLSIAGEDSTTEESIENILKHCKTFEDLSNYMKKVEHPKKFVRMKVVMDMNITIDRKNILIDKYKDSSSNKFLDDSNYTFMKDLTDVEEKEMNEALFGLK